MTKNEGMVKNMAENFQDKGLEVLYAKCNGFPDPTDVQGVKPDVVGWDPQNELYHLGIVADSETITYDSTKEKINTLAKMMMGVGTSEGERLPFYVGVTKEASTITDKKLQENNLISQGNIEKILV
ncbi:hypothetical protein NsoK4_06450 [Nitrosopumilus sp. K4]|uniref:hypothetical protein n=1 Tax=Nitrosopumilus sp. K4 TaxID=2795383 RepID=UPI001BACFE1F|nr:hypothetical protein [Nitrosopumilus sp. K4]QUC64085.1 hypothetical protein NsoK4_06450 [Nitrosopumilus sp. K4]